VGILHGLLRRLVGGGATVVVATHHGALAAACDHVVAFGPGVGPEGGHVVEEGPPGSLRLGDEPW
jgi:excinuclease ABC subunit A